MAEKTLAQVLKDEREKRAGRVGSLVDFDMNVRALTTGNLAIDAVTGVGGLPRGRVTELFGRPSSGKTSTALQTAAKVQQAGGTVLYLDYERSLDEKYCTALGIDVDAETFIYSQPAHFEGGINLLRKAVATGELDLAIIDSVARMVSEKELEAETGKAFVGDRAKLMAQALRQLVGPIQDHDVAIVFLNHIQDVIDATPMGARMASRGIKATTTPGGDSLKFYCSLRMEYKQIGQVRKVTIDPLTKEEVKDVQEIRTQVTVVKNKVGIPRRTAEVLVRFGRGFSQAASVLHVLVAHKVINKKSGGTFEFPDGLGQLDGPETMRGEEAVLAAIESNEEWLSRLLARAEIALSDFGVAQVPEGVYDDDGDILTEALAEAEL